MHKISKLKQTKTHQLPTEAQEDNMIYLYRKHNGCPNIWEAGDALRIRRRLFKVAWTAIEAEDAARGGADCTERE